ncbi:MAG: hypothetical protein A2Y38_02225 [Spirochaetes bacterium GWB1_59_5]|nr:MAG: hypothetical protein A2Y38_02225 [Spirochaetes bacterium GWB1_59_5]
MGRPHARKPLLRRKPGSGQDLQRQMAQQAQVLGQSFATFGATTRPPEWVEDPPDRPGPRRVLYHFTAPTRLGFIMRQGINRGDVPITPRGGYNAPWLTDDPTFDAQGWSNGCREPKGSVRLTVELAEDDPLLRHWPALAQAEGVDPFWYQMLDTAGSAGLASSADHWYVYKGTIPTRWITGVEANPDSKLTGIGSSANEELTLLLRSLTGSK